MTDYVLFLLIEGTNVKLEGQDGETITDIQNYLETFNKEIQGKQIKSYVDVASTLTLIQ